MAYACIESQISSIAQCYAQSIVVCIMQLTPSLRQTITFVNTGRLAILTIPATAERPPWSTPSEP